MAKTIKITEDGLIKLQEELEMLKTKGRADIAEKIKVARGYGDLSENSEYDEAKTEQGKLYSRIAELKNLIDNAEIIEKGKETGKITLGSIVTVVDLETNEEETYKIVGTQEANPMEGKISDDSPFGSALIGHKEGDTVEIDVPAGVLRFTIKAITK